MYNKIWFNEQSRTIKIDRRNRLLDLYNPSCFRFSLTRYIKKKKDYSPPRFILKKSSPPRQFLHDPIINNHPSWSFPSNGVRRIWARPFRGRRRDRTNLDIMSKVVVCGSKAMEDNVVRLCCITPGLSRLITRTCMCVGRIRNIPYKSRANVPPPFPLSPFFPRLRV